MKNIEQKVNEIIELIDEGIDYEIEDGRTLSLRGKTLENTKYHLRKILVGE